MAFYQFYLRLRSASSEVLYSIHQNTNNFKLRNLFSAAITLSILLYGCSYKSISAKSEEIVISGNGYKALSDYEEGDAGITTLKGYEASKSDQIAVGYFLILDPGIKYVSYSSSLVRNGPIQIHREKNGIGKHSREIYKWLIFEIKFNSDTHSFTIEDQSFNRKDGNIFLVILDENWKSRTFQISQVQEKLLQEDEVLKIIQKNFPKNEEVQKLVIKNKISK